MTSATVQVPGTCGELIQGYLDGRYFLVSCPIGIYSTVTVELTHDGVVEAANNIPKSEAALRLAMALFGVDPGIGARLTIESPLPRGKGMGSSTADVAGAVYALVAALGCKVEPWAVAKLAVDIEPTNSSLFPGLAVFDHREALFYKPLGSPPPADVLVLDCGGEVDTLEYNAIDRTAQLREFEREFSQALALVRRGIAESDLLTLARGSTMSALVQQNILYKAPLEDVIGVGRELGAAGVTVAHSGTVIGVLFPPGSKNRAENPLISSQLVARVSGVTPIGWFPLAAGGVRAPRTLVSPNH